MRVFSTHFVLFISFFVSNLYAGTGSGVVTSILVHEKNKSEGLVVFSTSENKDKATCSNASKGNDWAFDAHTPQGQAMYALILAAATSGQRIYVLGTGNCEAWPDRETPVYIKTVFD